MCQGIISRSFFLFVVTVFFASAVMAESKTIFKGRPQYVINEFGVFREAGPADPGKASLVEVVISEIGGKYYWASRENRELTKVVSGNPYGSIVTFLATDATGYIRIVTGPWQENMQTRFLGYDLNYTEHMMQGLGSLTYFGKGELHSK